MPLLVYVYMYVCDPDEMIVGVMQYVDICIHVLYGILRSIVNGRNDVNHVIQGLDQSWSGG